MELDERMKDLLRSKSKSGFAIVSVYDADFTKKNRKNTKRAKILENLIIENKIVHKTIIIKHENNEEDYNFILFADDQFTQENLKKFIDESSKLECFHVFNVSYDLENLIKNRTFYHPVRKAEKSQFMEKYEIILEDLYEPPENVGGWTLIKATNEDFYCYSCNERTNILCCVSELYNGKWSKSYGGYIPCGFNIKKDYASSREEALSSFSYLKN